jgi:hypothetical protein
MIIKSVHHIIIASFAPYPTQVKERRKGCTQLHDSSVRSRTVEIDLTIRTYTGTSVYGDSYAGPCIIGVER